MKNKRFVYVVYIAAPAESVWKALTTPEDSRKYWFGFSIQSDWKVGSPVRILSKESVEKNVVGPMDVQGSVLAIKPNRRLSYTFAVAPAEGKPAREHPSRVIFEITPFKSFVKLTLIHDDLLPEDFEQRHDTLRGINNGWPAILSGLKSLVETTHAIDFDLSKMM